jgi:hypothetical protein
MLLAERDLARARLSARDGNGTSDASYAEAIRILREQSTPYHLAQGLLDHAQHLLSQGDAPAAATVIDEARDIARHLGCQPILDRITAAAPAQSVTRS